MRRERDRSWDLILTYLVGLIAVMVLGCLAFGCTRKVYVPVESVRTEYRDRGSVRVDTVIEADTRFVYVNGDTVRDYRTRWRERVREVHDTVVREVRDTVTRTVTIEVERKPTPWQRAKEITGLAAIGMLLIAAVIWLSRRINIFKK